MLALAGIVHVATAAAFVAVGLRLRARHVAPAVGLARDAFVAWWLCFAGYLLGQGLVDLAAAAGHASFHLVLAFRLVQGPLIAAAAWGLAYHILFLWTGLRGLAVPLAFYYGAAGTLYASWIWWHGPHAVVVDAWAVDLAFSSPVEGPVWSAVLASIGLPLVLGAVGYLALLPKAEERERRYRIALVGSSLLVWITSGYAAQVAAGDAVRFVAIVVLGLLTAGAVLAAYFPPAPVRRWLHRPAAPAGPSA